MLHDAVTVLPVYVEVMVLLALVGRYRSREDTVAPASVATFDPVAPKRLCKTTWRPLAARRTVVQEPRKEVIRE